MATSAASGAKKPFPTATVKHVFHEGKRADTPTLTVGNIGEHRADILRNHELFEASAGHFRQFVDTFRQAGQLREMALLANRESFLADTVRRAATDATWRNKVAEVMNGSRKFEGWRQVSDDIWGATLLAHVFASLPIEDNLLATAGAQGSIVQLRELAGKDRGFIDQLRGVVTGTAAALTLGENEIAFGDLRFRIRANGELVRPEKVSEAGSIQMIGGRRSFLGIPQDRTGLPSWILNEGAGLAIEVENTSPKNNYAVIPVLNGMPIDIERAIFEFNDFFLSPFPLRLFHPRANYLRAGATQTFDHLHANEIALARAREELKADIIHKGFGGRSGKPGEDLGRGVKRIFEEWTTLVHGEINELALYLDPEYRAAVAAELAVMRELIPNEIRYQYWYLNNLLDYAMAVTDHLTGRATSYGDSHTTDKASAAWSAPLLMGAPTFVSDHTASADLPQPFLGSLGFLVFQVEKPPVLVQNYLLRGPSGGGYGDLGSTTRSFGGGGDGSSLGLAAVGLARIGAGDAEMSGVKPEDAAFVGHNHTFVGFAMTNLLSRQKA